MEATDHRLSLAIQLATLELKLHDFIQALERRYSPDQPRVPAGSPDGGQWSDRGGSGVSRPDSSRPIRVALGAKLIGQG